MANPDYGMDGTYLHEVFDDATDVEICNGIADWYFERCGNKAEEPITATFTDKNGKSSTFKAPSF